MDRAGKILKLSCVHDHNILGNGIGIALFDTGLASVHPDFQKNNKIVAFRDFVRGRTGCYDDSGHGTHVAGIANVLLAEPPDVKMIFSDFPLINSATFFRACSIICRASTPL